MENKDGVISDIMCPSCGDMQVGAFAVDEDTIWLQCMHCLAIFQIGTW